VKRVLDASAVERGGQTSTNSSAVMSECLKIAAADRVGQATQLEDLEVMAAGVVSTGSGQWN